MSFQYSTRQFPFHLPGAIFLYSASAMDGTVLRNVVKCPLASIRERFFRMNSILLITSYFIIVNIAGFAAMGIDKHKAKAGSFRIPEATLFILALIGGSIGSIVGMFLFRHKTRHWYFLVFMPAILIIQIITVIVLCYYVNFSFM